MPYFREADTKRKQNSWSDEAHGVLTLAIQTIDELDQNAATVELRQRLDLILNSRHWSEKRRDEREAINEPAWRTAWTKTQELKEKIAKREK